MWLLVPLVLWGGAVEASGLGSLKGPGPTRNDQRDHFKDSDHYYNEIEDDYYYYYDDDDNDYYYNYYDDYGYYYDDNEYYYDGEVHLAPVLYVPNGGGQRHHFRHKRPSENQLPYRNDIQKSDFWGNFLGKIWFLWSFY